MGAENGAMRKPSLYIFALDAGDPGWIEQWMSEGYLPAISSMVARGVWGRTGGVELISEHGVWHSLFSGVPRGRHGCYYFRQLVPRSYGLTPFTGRDVKAVPFWNELRHDHDRVAILDAHDILIVPGLNGVQLANWATHRGWVSNDPVHAPQSYPPRFISQVQKVAGARQEILEKTGSTLEEDRALFRALLKRIESKGELCRHVLRNELQTDNGNNLESAVVSVMMFGESHTAAHQFWQYRPEAPDSERKEAGLDLRHAIREVYCAIDREIGTLLELLPQDSNISVLSSLGLEPHYPYDGVMQAACRALGYQVRMSTAAQSRRLSWKPLDIARRVLPGSWRIAASRMLSRDAREKLLAEQFCRETDWSRTQAYAVPSFYTGFIRVNLRGRDPEGIVASEEYSQLLSRISEDFYQLRDGATGEPIVRRVWRAGEVFGQEPPLEEVSGMPDLLIDFKPTTTPRERISHPRFESDIAVARGEFFRDSDHSQQGFWAIAGPNIKTLGKVGEIGLLDLAPTFLHLLGRTPPESMLGKALVILFSSQSTHAADKVEP